jgi:trimethylamine--corrinoid protein Co-methyltransferase
MISKFKIEILNKEQMDKIMDATYIVMEEIGMDIFLDEARDILKNAGCEVDGIRVKIPREVTKKAIALAPNGIQIYDRNGKPAMNLEGRDSYFGSGPTCPYFMDPETNERRESRKGDAANSAKVADALEHIDYTMSLVMIGDETGTLADVHEVDAMIRNTTKPMATWAFNKENLKDMFSLCEAVKGSKDAFRKEPFLIVYNEPTTPLTHSKEALEKLLLCSKHNVPGIYTPGMIMGGTAPCTIAGALPVGLADTLTGVVISQNYAPGCPIICGTSGTPMDMKTMQTPYGAPETSMLLGASNEIMDYIGLPCFDMAGATDAKVIDAQAGMEASMEIMISLMSGGNLIHDSGFMDIGMMGSLSHMVVCNEAIGMAKRYCRGVDIDDAAIDIENIRQVGPGGNFLAQMHTAKYFKSEFWMPSILERRTYQGWTEDGSKDLATKAHDKVREILANHKPEELPADVLVKLDEIVASAEKRETEAMQAAK